MYWIFSYNNNYNFLFLLEKFECRDMQKFARFIFFRIKKKNEGKMLGILSKTYVRYFKNC